MMLQPQSFAVVPPTEVPVDDDPVASYAAMDSAVAALPASTALGSPILPCQEPMIEVSLLDEDNAPLAKVPYRLMLEETTLAEGTLDDQGYASVPKQELPAGDWHIEVTLQRNETTQLVERADILLTAAPPAEEDDPQAEPGEIEDAQWLELPDDALLWD